MLLCLRSEEFIGVEEPVNPSENDKIVWDYKMTDLVRIKRVLKSNLCNRFTLLMALCDTDVKNHVKAPSKLQGYEQETGLYGPYEVNQEDCVHRWQ